MTNKTYSTPEAQALAERLEVERALTANHANTLPMLEILRACAAAPEPRPYREVEDEVYDLPAISPSTICWASRLLVRRRLRRSSP